MYHRRFRKPSKPTIFAMLMLAAVVVSLLPRDFFGSARDLTQLVALPGAAVTQAANRVSDSAKALSAEPVPAQKFQETLQAKQATENENIALRQQIMQLQNTVAGLQQLRSRSQFPSDGRLIPARVVGWDAVPGRDSLMLLKGRSDIRDGSWVASRFPVRAGSEDGVRDELRVLARETLIGWIEQSAPFTSRVVLLSDRYTNRVWRVHIAAVGRKDRETEFVAPAPGQDPADFALEGIGNGQMRILDINASYIKQGLIQVGDVITTDGHDPKLPLAMVIGDIVELQPVKKQPLLYHAIVKHRCDPKDMSEVFIVDVSH